MPLRRFQAVEQAAPLPLPPTRYEPAVWHEAMVHTDTHVVFGKAMYSVPWRFIGKQMMVRACGDSVALFFEDMRNATHERATPGKRRTIEAHLPEGAVTCGTAASSTGRTAPTRSATRSARTSATS